MYIECLNLRVHEIVTFFISQQKSTSLRSCRNGKMLDMSVSGYVCVDIFAKFSHSVQKFIKIFPILWQERRVLMENLHTVASSATPLRNELIRPKMGGLR